MCVHACYVWCTIHTACTVIMIWQFANLSNCHFTVQCVQVFDKRHLNYYPNYHCVPTGFFGKCCVSQIICIIRYIRWYIDCLYTCSPQYVVKSVRTLKIKVIDSFMPGCVIDIWWSRYLIWDRMTSVVTWGFSQAL